MQTEDVPHRVPARKPNTASGQRAGEALVSFSFDPCRYHVFEQLLTNADARRLPLNYFATRWRYRTFSLLKRRNRDRLLGKANTPLKTASHKETLYEATTFVVWGCGATVEEANKWMTAMGKGASQAQVEFEKKKKRNPPILEDIVFQAEVVPLRGAQFGK